MVSATGSIAKHRVCFVSHDGYFAFLGKVCISQQVSMNTYVCFCAATFFEGKLKVERTSDQLRVPAH